jgi:hypothetical protein
MKRVMLFANENEEKLDIEEEGMPEKSRENENDPKKIKEKEDFINTKKLNILRTYEEAVASIDSQKAIGKYTQVSYSYFFFY